MRQNGKKSKHLWVSHTHQPSKSSNIFVSVHCPFRCSINLLSLSFDCSFSRGFKWLALINSGTGKYVKKLSAIGMAWRILRNCTMRDLFYGVRIWVCEPDDTPIQVNWGTPEVWRHLSKFIWNEWNIMDRIIHRADWSQFNSNWFTPKAQSRSIFQMNDSMRFHAEWIFE